MTKPVSPPPQGSTDIHSPVWQQWFYQWYQYSKGLPIPVVYAPVATGFSTTIPDYVPNFVIDNSAVFAAGTVVLPANPFNGQTQAILVARNAVTALTVNANTGQTVLGGGVIATTSNTSYSWVFSQANLTWYRAK